MIDGTGAPPVYTSSVSIEDGVIAAIRTASEAPAPLRSGTTVVEGSGRWMIPGLWDTHIHHSLSGGGVAVPDEWYPAPREWQWDVYLRHGVTSVVSVGDVGSEIFGSRQAERRGELRAPRIFAAGPLLTAPGGHPSGTVFTDHPTLATGTVREVSNAEEARARVQELIGHGADLIKTVYSSGPWRAPRLALEVLTAIVETAHSGGLRVVCHVGTPGEATEAIGAGVDGLEHMVLGASLDIDETIRAAVSSGATWTPTLSLFSSFAHAGSAEYAEEWFPHGTPEFVRASLGHQGSRWLGPPAPLLEPTVAATGSAHRAGVTLALGTDAGNPGVFHGSAVNLELSLLVAAGLSPLAAIVAATFNAATKVGLEATLGTVEVGKEADLVVLDADPLADVMNTRRVRAVIKRGQLM